MFREPSLCRHVRRELLRKAALNLTLIIPVTVCHQISYVERYSRYMDDTEDAVALMLDNQSLVVSLQDRVTLGPDHVELSHKRHHRIVVFGFLNIPRKPIQVGEDREG